MSQAKNCPECGAPILEDAPKGYCPACLVRLGAEGLFPPDALKTPAPDGKVSPKPIAAGAATCPTLFGGYELLGEIGRGGMGVVYKARQVALNRTVALKMLLHGRFSEPAFFARFHLEAEAAAHLDHPNIVPIHEVGVFQGQPFYSMKLIEGQSLERELSRGPMPAKKSAQLIAIVARAVAFAHQHGVLHRDIKPHNILLDSAGQPHLTDFGLAKLVNQESELTMSAAVIGSPGFMAPEQAVGKPRQVTTAADVYGLGAVLYALLTGRAVFQAETPLETVRRVIEQAPVRPRVLNPSVHRDLETICLKCLQKEPAKRYVSAQALADDLESWLRGAPIQARPVNTFERAWLWCRRQPVRAGLIGALVLALVLGLSGVLWQWNRAKAGELRARENAYAADMSLAQTALEKFDLGGALEALNRQRPLPGQKDLRGWEWRHFWQRCQSDERFLLCKHSEGVGGLGFSADGKWLALRTKGGAVQLWDAVSREQVLELPGAGDDRALAVSPAGDFLAYGNMESNGAPVVCLYGIVEQRELARFPQSAEVAFCAFSAKESLFATWTEDGMVSLRQPRTGRVLANIQTAQPQPSHGRMLFSPDGQFLALGQQINILLWEWSSGSQRRIRTPGIGDAVTALAFSPDGKRLGAACSRIQIWDVSNLSSLSMDSEVPMLGQSDQQPGWIVDLAFAPDGRTLAIAGTDPRIGLWDVKTLRQRRQFRGNAHTVRAVAFSPNGKDLVSGSEDGSVRYFDPAAEEVWHSPAVVPMPVWCPAFTFAPDSKHFIALDSRDGVASLWSIAPLRQLERLSFLGASNNTIRLSPDGRLLAIGDRSGNVRVWDYSSRRAITNFPNPGYAVGTLKFQGSGRTLMCGLVPLNPGGFDARFWDTRTWSEIRKPPDFPSGRGAWAAVSADNRVLAALDVQGTVAWWEMASGRRLARFEHHFGGAEGYLMFSTVAPLLAGSTTDGVTTIWNITTGRIAATIRANFKAVHGVAFSPDGHRLLSGGEDAKDVVRLLDLRSQRHVATLAGKSDAFWFLEMSNDLNILAAVGMANTALLWRAPSWEEIEAAESLAKPQLGRAVAGGKQRGLKHPKPEGPGARPPNPRQGPNPRS